MINRKTPTGWAQFCFKHDDAFHLDGVKKRIAEKGLDRRDDETREQWIRRLLAYMHKCGFGKMLPPAIREPGEDTDEDIYGATT